MDKKWDCRINMRQPRTDKKSRSKVGILGHSMAEVVDSAFSGDTGNLHGTELSNII